MSTDSLITGQLNAKSADLIEQIQQLRKTLNYHSHHYYVLDAPEIPDVEYDKLFRQLESLESQYPELVTLDSPTQRVGGQILDGFKQVTHQLPMLSLSNAFSAEEIEDFIRTAKYHLENFTPSTA